MNSIKIDPSTVNTTILFPTLKKYKDKFLSYLRMPTDCFEYILSKVELDLTSNRCNLHKSPILPEEKVVVTLRFLITASSYRTLSFSFRIGTSTIQNIIRDTISSLEKSEFHPYACTKKGTVSACSSTFFYSKTGFPHCLGALDDKHCRIKCPEKSGTMYFNYKHYNSIVLQGVVDSDYKFIFIDVGGYGKQHDSSTLRASGFYRALTSGKLQIPEPMELPDSNLVVPFVFISDGAYPLQQNIIKPYSGKNLTPDQQKFDKILSGARMSIECAFGQMTKRFAVIKDSMEQKPELAIDIMKCTCLLHNIIIDKCKLNQTSPFFGRASDIVHANDTNEENELLGSEVRNKFTRYLSRRR